MSEIKKENKFLELEYIETKTIGYDINWIGINRIIRRYLNHIPKISRNQNIENKKSLYQKYCIWFNIHFNKISDEKIYSESWNR